VSWARQVIADQGAERSDGLVAVLGSQADISAACGFARNDGRVYAYLRDLAAGGVTQCERGMILFDPERLGAMERALVVRRLTPRTMEIATALSHQFGRPAADGTVTLQIDSDRDSWAPIPPRLTDMGDALGMSRSSAQRHMSSLRSHGYLAGGRRRGGPLRLVPDAGPGPDQVLWQLVNAQAELVSLLSAAHTLRDEAQRLSDHIGADDGPAESQGALSRLAETQAELIGTFSRAHSLRDEIDDIYRLLPSSAPFAPVLRAEKGADCGAEGADESAERRAGPEEKIRKDLPSSSLFFSDQGADRIGQSAGQKARNEARTTDDGSVKHQQMDGDEGPAGGGWGTGDLALMCAGLSEACQARGRQGANNWAGLAQALTGYTRDQVIAAQRTLANDVRSSRPINNPFGLLAKVASPAHPQHLCYFRPERARPEFRLPSPIAQPDGPGAAHEEDPDVDAARAVAALEASGPSEELDALDRYARSHMYRFTLRVFEHLSEKGRRGARAAAWRALHPLPSPDGHQQDKDGIK
jgi:hypothetical protein